jgi:diketogulonate reductase-like aldo/keto reductase
VALNYLTRHHNVFTIPKTTHLERAIENSGGTGWKLNEDILAIELVFPVQESDTLQMI